MNTAKGNNTILNVVLDSNIIISALFFGGKPRKILDLILGKAIVGITSPYIIFELKDVLRRRKFNIDEEKIEEVEKLLKKYFQIISPKTQMNLIKDYHPDNKILALTIYAKADYLITGDRKHILPLRQIQETRIVIAEGFLNEYESQELGRLSVV